VKIHRQLVAWNDVQVVRVVGNLMCVHNRAGYFDGAHKVEVVVAKVVCELFNLLVGQSGSVLGHVIVHRQGSSNCGLVRDHVEIECTVSRMLDEALIDNCPRGRVGVVIS